MDEQAGTEAKGGEKSSASSPVGAISVPTLFHPSLVPMSMLLMTGPPMAVSLSALPPVVFTVASLSLLAVGIYLVVRHVQKRHQTFALMPGAIIKGFLLGLCQEPEARLLKRSRAGSE